MTEQSANPIILLFGKDLYFSVKLSNELKQLGYQPRSVSGRNFNAALAADPAPALVLLDLNKTMMREEEWQTALASAREADLLHVPVIAFGPHTDLDLRRRALAAGVRAFVANSKAMSDVGKLVAKYVGNPAAHEEEQVGD